MIVIRSKLNEQELDKKINEQSENRLSLNLTWLATHNLDGSRKYQKDKSARKNYNNIKKENIQEDINDAKSIIADQIRGEWEAIRNYNKAVVDLEKYDGNFQDTIDLLNDIANEEEVHVGELEKAQAEIDTNVLSNIEDGKEEAEEKISEPAKDLNQEAIIGEKLELTESSLVLKQISLPDKYYIECFWDKYDGYVVSGGYEQEDGLVHDDYYKTYATKEDALRAYERFIKRHKLQESIIRTNNGVAKCQVVIDDDTDHFYTTKDSDIQLSGKVDRQGIWKNFCDDLECERKDLEINWIADDNDKRYYEIIYTQPKAEEQLSEAALSYSDQFNKMREWHNGTRGANIKSMSDEKLKMNHDICAKNGFYKEVSILRAEATQRGLPWGNIFADWDANCAEMMGWGNKTGFACLEIKKMDIRPADGYFVRDHTPGEIFNDVIWSSKHGLHELEIRLLWAMVVAPEKVNALKNYLNQFGIDDKMLNISLGEAADDNAIIARLHLD